MAAQKITALRFQVSSLGADGEPLQKRGGRYDIVFDENGVPELSNEEIADLFAGVARDSVLYELNESREVKI